MQQKKGHRYGWRQEVLEVAGSTGVMIGVINWVESLPPPCFTSAESPVKSNGKATRNAKALPLYGNILKFFKDGIFIKKFADDHHLLLYRYGWNGVSSKRKELTGFRNRILWIAYMRRESNIFVVLNVTMHLVKSTRNEIKLFVFVVLSRFFIKSQNLNIKKVSY